MQPLDLTEHDIDHVAGKGITINRTDYEILPLLGEGGEKFVYPLTNTFSKLVQFVIKIHKLRPDSPEGAETAKSYEGGRLGFGLRLASGISSPKEEMHEIGGCLLTFQPIVSAAETPDSHLELFNMGTSLSQPSTVQEAIACFDKILALNPNHSDAMVNKAGCLYAVGDANAALTLLQQASNIEPNDSAIFLNTAEMLRLSGAPHAALQILDLYLTIHQPDVDVWTKLLEIAVEAQARDVAQFWLEQVRSFPLVKDAEAFRLWEANIAALPKSSRSPSQPPITGIFAKVLIGKT